MGKRFIQAILLCICVMPCLAGSMTWISYQAEEFGGGRWEYTYEVDNFSLLVNSQPAAIKEFTIWFDLGLYSNLVVTTAAPLSNTWDQIVWQPEPVLHDAGGFDALAMLINPGIGVGQSVKGFSVSFNWLGQGSPGSQRYEIINPITFGTIDAGDTIIPEPASAAIMILGAVWMAAKRRR
jgi:hypothetical protein